MRHISVSDVFLTVFCLVVGLALATLARSPDAVKPGERQGTFALGLVVGFGLLIFCVVTTGLKRSSNTERNFRE